MLKEELESWILGYFIVTNHSNMKIISKSHITMHHKRQSSATTGSKQSQLTSEYLPLDLLQKNTDSNITVPHTGPFLKNTSAKGFFPTSNNRSRIDKEWKAYLDCKILSINQIIGDKKGKTENSNKQHPYPFSRHQKLEVSLSKRTKRFNTPNIDSTGPRLSEVGRNSSFLRSFSRQSRIVDSVEGRLDGLLESDPNFCP